MLVLVSSSSSSLLLCVVVVVVVKKHKDLFMPVHLFTIVMIPYIRSDMK